jgi:hypothetical protein
MTAFPALDKKLFYMGLLAMIKKLTYTGNVNNLKYKRQQGYGGIHEPHAYVPRKFQDIQEFRDQ